MKILRILLLLASLNISFAHAGDEMSPIARLAVSGIKYVAVYVGILCIGDGIFEVTDGKSLLPSIEISESSTINGSIKTGIGVALFLAGQPN
jgi:hypothetical protein